MHIPPPGAADFLPSSPPTAAIRMSVIQLDQFLKLQGIAGTGGQAKMLIQGGEVRVNGEMETRRRRKLKLGDVVEVGDERIVVEADEGGDTEEPMP